MRTAVLHPAGQRPLSSTLIAVCALGLFVPLSLGMGLLLARTNLGRVLMFLAEHALSTVPMLLWIAAVLVVAVWLAVVVPVWRRQASSSQDGSEPARSASGIEVRL